MRKNTILTRFWILKVIQASKSCYLIDLLIWYLDGYDLFKDFWKNNELNVGRKVLYFNIEAWDWAIVFVMNLEIYKGKFFYPLLKIYKYWVIWYWKKWVRLYYKKVWLQMKKTDGTHYNYIISQEISKQQWKQNLTTSF